MGEHGQPVTGRAPIGEGDGRGAALVVVDLLDELWEPDIILEPLKNVFRVLERDSEQDTVEIYCPVYLVCVDDVAQKLS